jgi:hypothetical protein
MAKQHSSSASVVIYDIGPIDLFPHSFGRHFSTVELSIISGILTFPLDPHYRWKRVGRASSLGLSAEVFRCQVMKLTFIFFPGRNLP